MITPTHTPRPKPSSSTASTPNRSLRTEPSLLLSHEGMIPLPGMTHSHLNDPPTLPSLLLVRRREQGTAPWQPSTKITEKAPSGNVKYLLWWLPSAPLSTAFGCSQPADKYTWKMYRRRVLKGTKYANSIPGALCSREDVKTWAWLPCNTFARSHQSFLQA